MSPSPVVRSVAPYGKSAEKSAQVPTSEVRDELVRAVMPELRVLMQHLVNAAVERSIAPLLDKQRELEATLEDLRSAQLRTAQSASNPAKHAPALATATQAVYVEANPFLTEQTVSREVVAPVHATVVARPAVSARNDFVAAAAYDTNTLVDIPIELNGARRKKAVIWMFAVIAVALLLFVIGLSVQSNMGTGI